MENMNLIELKDEHKQIVLLQIINKKIKLHLSKDELLTLSKLLREWVINTNNSDLSEKASTCIILNLLEKKIRPKAMKMKPEYEIKLNIMQAYVVNSVLLDMIISELGTYEQTFAHRIINQIEQETI